MIGTYLTRFTHISFLISLLFSFVFGLQKLFYIVLIFYFSLCLIFRRKKSPYREDATLKEGILLSPANGRIQHVRSGIEHTVFGRDLVEIKVTLPWWREMGIFLPFSCEVRDLIARQGKSYFRYTDHAFSSQSEDVFDGICLILEGPKGERIGLQLLECKLGLWPQITVMPGDRGKRQVNIGHLPLGGTVLLYLPQNYEILVNTDEDVIAGESLIASAQEETL